MVSPRQGRTEQEARFSIKDERPGPALSREAWRFFDLLFFAPLIKLALA